jgi:hypothetical protein
MDFVHRCHFCGWQREARSPTILQPQCHACGCLLASGNPEEFASDRPVDLSLTRGINVPPRAGPALRLGGFAAVLFTAAATGFQAGGPWMAIGAFGATGLAVTPALVRG